MKSHMAINFTRNFKGIWQSSAIPHPYVNYTTLLNNCVMLSATGWFIFVLQSEGSNLRHLI
jgi:hypothetical protein